MGREIVVERKVVALCRCGKSRSRPLCDGTHKLIHFRAPSGLEDGFANESRAAAANGPRTGARSRPGSRPRLCPVEEALRQPGGAGRAAPSLSKVSRWRIAPFASASCGRLPTARSRPGAGSRFQLAHRLREALPGRLGLAALEVRHLTLDAVASSRPAVLLDAPGGHGD